MVSALFGDTTAFRYADEEVMGLAEALRTVGAEGVKVVNDSTAPNPGPEELLAIAQK
mgnify:CR=1 FL=1